jgi:hypothetical protein
MSPSLDSRENRDAAVEMKFLLTPTVADQIRDWARARLQPDPNAAGSSRDLYRITSLYFDTPNFDVFHRNGSFGRAKYRIRRYGAAEVAFLERKLRTRKMLTKRRSIIRLDDLKRLAEPEPARDWVGHWFHRRILKRGVAPVCQVTYLRAARIAMTNQGPIRLTLDEDLHALPAAGLHFCDAEGDPILANRIVLELKFRFDLPALFKNLVEEFALNTQSFSKYRTAASALGLVPTAAAAPSNIPAPLCLNS